MSVDDRARRRAFTSDPSGGTAVEFGLISSLLFMVLLAVVQIGWALHCAASVKWALETNARALMLTPGLTATQLRSAMIAQLSGLADPNNITVTIATDTSTAGVTILRAHSVYTHNLTIAMLPAWNLTFDANTDVPTT